MRILYVSRGYTTHDFRFLTTLAETRHEIWYLPLEDDRGAFELRQLPTRIRVATLQLEDAKISSPEDVLRLMPSFREVLDQVKPDVVHAGPTQTCGLMAALSGHHPFVLMSWGYDILWDSARDPMWQWVTTFVLSQSDMLLCDSDAVVTKARTLAPYPDDRIVKLPWGIEPHRFASKTAGRALRDRLQWVDNLIFLSVRSWEPLYGVDVLLKAFHKAHQENPMLRLMLLGDGGLRHWIEDFIRSAGLGDAVFAPGRIPNDQLPAFYRAADFYVSTSYTDGASVSLLEAMASELPAIVTEIPGNLEWIEHGWNGWLVPSGDEKSLAAQILTVASLDPNAREAIGGRGRQVVLEKADWARNAQRVIIAYDQLASVTRRKRSGN